MGRLCWSLFGVIFFVSIASAGPRIDREKFGTLPDGTVIDIYTLTNSGGATAKIINYGATLTSFVVPDRDKKLTDVVLGYDDLKGYLDGGAYFGATIGRVANRIGGAKFTLDGHEYKLSANDGKNSLHGGKKGFDKQVWSGQTRIKGDHAKLILSYISKDGEEGYPGTLNVTVEYSLTPGNTLSIEYTAYTDKATPVNLTHHSYFNLNGHNSGDILDHELIIQADKYTPTDKDLIPTGKIETVKGTAMDFTTSAVIGKRMKETGLEGGGYDHNYVLFGQKGQQEKAAEVTGSKSGIRMVISTTEPGLQFYTGNGLGKEIGKGGVKYPQYGAFCLEAQHYPDSPNRPEFPSIILKPGQIYKQKTVHLFSTK